VDVWEGLLRVDVCECGAHRAAALHALAHDHWGEVLRVRDRRRAKLAGECTRPKCGEPRPHDGRFRGERLQCRCLVLQQQSSHHQVVQLLLLPARLPLTK
jgi:hypothetical protein